MEDFISENIKLSIEADERAVSAKLRNLRLRACIKLDEFAEALGVETSELESYENGIEDVPASVIAMACALSGTPFEYFFGDDSDDAPREVINHSRVSEEQTVFLS